MGHPQGPRTSRPSSLFLFCTLFVLTLPATLSAAQAKVNLSAQVIYAATEAGGIDDRLGALATELQRTFRFSMYQLLDSPKGSASSSEPWILALPGNRRLDVSLTSIQHARFHLTVRVFSANGKPLLRTAIILQSGGPPALVGGLKHERGVLIIALTAD